MKSPFRRVDHVRNPDAIEKRYSEIESSAAVIRDKLLSGISLSEPERVNWSKFLAILEHRTPMAMRKMMEHFESVRERLGSIFNADALAELDLEAMAKNAIITTPVLGHDRDEHFSTTLLNYNWAMIRANGNLEFISADYPLGFIEDDTGRRVLFWLALSPDLLFAASCLDWTVEIEGYTRIFANLQLIHQRPNFIYSRKRLEDGAVFKLLKAAIDCLPIPDFQ